MEISQTEIDGVRVVEPRRFDDARGWFRETCNPALEAELGVRFVQDNESMSMRVGTIRGLHLQVAPNAQAKLVRVVRGAIDDVAVDLRPGSRTRNEYVSRRLTAAGSMLFIPAGCAHGFVTLEPDTVVVYKVTAPYDASAERSIRFDDPDLAIDWGVAPDEAIVSEKDRAAVGLSEFLSGGST